MSGGSFDVHVKIHLEVTKSIKVGKVFQEIQVYDAHYKKRLSSQYNIASLGKKQMGETLVNVSHDPHSVEGKYAHKLFQLITLLKIINQAKSAYNFRRLKF